MEHRQDAAAGASSSMSSVNCSAMEDVQPHAAVTADSVYASALEDPPSAVAMTSSHQQYWTAIDNTTDNEDDYPFVREIPGTKSIRQIERQHIKLLEKIGEGGQGTIYTAQIYMRNEASGEYEPEDKCCVAKVFKGRNFGQWPEDTFGLGTLNPRVCKFLGYCVEGDTFILLMRKYDCSLRDVLDKRMKMRKKASVGSPLLPDYKVVALIIQVAVGMEFLHEHGLLHRDLKADNIFVDLLDNGEPAVACIGDFDVASNVIGTFFWRAPEVLQALRDRKPLVFSPQSDVYSYAMTCYEILTGAIPFDGERASNYDLVLSGKRPSLPSNLNPKVKDLLNRCWHPDPSMRPSFRAIAEELRGLHRELISGSELMSKYLDEQFDSGANRVNLETCLVQLKELLETLVLKYGQADFLDLCYEVVADFELYKSQFGLRLPGQPRRQVPHSEWLASMVLLDSTQWKIKVFSHTSPDVLEKTTLCSLMYKTASVVSAVSPELSGSSKEAAVAGRLAWWRERENRVLPENPHRACEEQLNTGHADDAFRACSFCKSAHDARNLSAKSGSYSLYVDI